MLRGGTALCMNIEYMIFFLFQRKHDGVLYHLYFRLQLCKHMLRCLILHFILILHLPQGSLIHPDRITVHFVVLGSSWGYNAI